jgi:hypothetical protein
VIGPGDTSRADLLEEFDEHALVEGYFERDEDEPEPDDDEPDDVEREDDP